MDIYWKKLVKFEDYIQPNRIMYVLLYVHVISDKIKVIYLGETRDGIRVL